MKKSITFLFLVLCAFTLNAQPRPSGIPNPNSAGYAKYGYMQADSGYLWGVRDTFPASKYTTILHNNGNFYKTPGGAGSYWTLWISKIAATVSQVNTNTSTGITGGPITTTGTIAADTLVLTTRARTKQQTDSIVGLISGGGFGTVLSVSTTDMFGITSTVTNPTSIPNIALKVDTTHNNKGVMTWNDGTRRLDSLGALKLNISDTGSMLAHYVNTFSNQTNISGTKQFNNAMVVSDTITAGSFIKSGGTSSQILAASGTSLVAGIGITITGGQIINTSPSSGGTVTSITGIQSIYSSPTIITSTGVISFLNDSAVLNGNKVYGYNGITRGWQNAIKINLSNPKNLDELQYDSLNSQFVNFTPPNVYNGAYQVTVGDGNVNTGDSVITNASFISKYLQVYREGERQNEDTVYGIRIDTLIGKVNFYPPLAVNEKILINTSALNLWDKIPRLEYINFSRKTDDLINNNNVWTSIGTSGLFTTLGISNPRLYLNNDGYIQATAAVGNQNAFLGFSTANTLPIGLASLWVGFSISSIYEINYVEMGTYNSTPVATVAVGNLVRIVRTSGAYKLQKSVNNGLSWTDIYSFSGGTINNNENYVIGVFYAAFGGGNQSFMNYPKGYNLK